MKKILVAGSISILIIMSIISGCASTGPKTIPRDRFNYTEAISESWKTQMLLNMVSIRYGDVPVFLDVTSIVNQYQWEGRLGLNAFYTDSSGALGNSGGGGIEAGGSYIERPTISYTPIMGEKFTKSIMTPIPPVSIFYLIQSGWSVDFVMSTCVQSISGIYNRDARQATVQPSDPEFDELLNVMRDIQRDRLMDLRIRKTIKQEGGEEGQSVIIFVKPHLSIDDYAKLNELQDLLGLPKYRREFRFVYGSIPENDDEVAILTRSMLDIMAELAAEIQVPEEHVLEDRVSTGVVYTEGAPGSEIPLVSVQSGVAKPDENVFVSAEYNDYWYWIDERDYRSKRAFTFLVLLFTLAQFGLEGVSPVLTISTG
jgi:hypothetical protein